MLLKRYAHVGEMAVFLAVFITFVLIRYAHVWEMAVFEAVFPLVNLKVPFPMAHHGPDHPIM